MKKWYGWVLVKRFKAKIKCNIADVFEIDTPRNAQKNFWKNWKKSYEIKTSIIN